MLEAGSGAVKGKEAANTFSLNEAAGGRKETYNIATGTMSVCLFSLTVSQKTFRGKENVEEVEEWANTGMSFEENVCQAFIVTATIYRNTGIPWLWM